MSSKPSLSDRPKKDLAELARRKGVRGWDRLTKEELIKALSKIPSKTKRPTPSKLVPRVKTSSRTLPASSKGTAKASKNGSSTHLNGTSKAKASAKPSLKTPVAKTALPAKKSKTKTITAAQAPTPKKPGKASATSTLTPSRLESTPIPAEKDLSTRSAKGVAIKDRILLTAADPFWLHAFWELSEQSVLRAEAALGQDWHGSRPILRLLDVTAQDTTSTSEAVVRDIVIHGGCNRWYIDVPQPPRSYRADIGYITRNGRFFPVCRSNVQTPPKSGASEVIEEGVPEVDSRSSAAAAFHDAEETFRRPMKETAFGTGAVLPGKLKKFFFDIDAELIVYGKTDPTASVTLQNEPVKLRPDGSFTMRFSLPDSRQIIPAVATSADGMEEQTIVLAVERNTKRLDPMIHDLYGET
jgi:uncharacterized protein